MSANFLSEAAAQSIGINFVGSTGAEGTLAQDDVAGVPGVAQGFWNNAAGASGSLSDLLDNTGQLTTLSTTWGDICGTGDNGTTGVGSDFVLMRGSLGGDCGPGLGFQLLDVPYAVYDVIVYMSGPGLGSGTLSYVSPGVATWPPVGQGYSPNVLYSSNFAGTFVEATATQAGNYYRFRGLNYGSVAITSIAFPMAGAQIVPVPGPPSVPTLLTASYVRVCCDPTTNIVNFSLDGTNLSYAITLYYPYGADPHLELHGPAPPGQDGPLFATLPSPSCNQIEFNGCTPITGVVGVTTVQAVELSSDLCYLLVTPVKPIYGLPQDRSQIINLSNPIPLLRAFVNSTEVRLQWPITSRGFVLEESPTFVGGGPWQTVTNVVDIIDQAYSVSLTSQMGGMFFRLRSGL